MARRPSALDLSSTMFAVMRCIVDHSGDAFHYCITKKQKLRREKSIAALIGRGLVMPKPLGMNALTIKGTELLRLKDLSDRRKLEQQRRAFKDGL